MLYALLAIGVFFTAAALDYAGARYWQAVQAREKHRAGRWAVAIGVLGLIAGATAYKVSLWYCIPELAGWYFGTCLAISKEEKIHE